jgi:hypothetical protein
LSFSGLVSSILAGVCDLRSGGNLAFFIIHHVRSYR